MRIFCEDCDAKLLSYGDWSTHLLTGEHQHQVQRSRIEQWVNGQHGNCLVFISLFQPKDSLEISTVFSEFQFLCNFYAHPNRKFFIAQFDTQQTAEHICTTLEKNNTWKLQVRRLTDLDIEDWFELFPTLYFNCQKKRKTTNDETAATHFSAVTSTQHVFTEQTEYEAQTDVRLRQEHLVSQHREFRSVSDMPPQIPLHLPQQMQIPSTSFSSNSTEHLFAHQANYEVQTDVRQRQEFRQDHDFRNGPSVPAQIPFAISPQIPSTSSNSTRTISFHPQPSSAKLQLIYKENALLEAQLEKFYNSTALHISELDGISETVVMNLAAALETEFPACEAYLYDSFQGGSGSSNNCVEINVDKLETFNGKFGLGTLEFGTNYHENSEKLVLIIGDLLKREYKPLGKNKKQWPIISISKHSVFSRIKFSHPAYPQLEFSLSCCMSPNQIMRRRNFKLITFYTRLNPAVRKLLCFVQYWASYHQIVGNFLFNDFALSLMVIYLLAMKNFVPTIQTLKTVCKKYMNVDDDNWLISFCDNEELTITVSMLFQNGLNSQQTNVVGLAYKFFHVFGNPELPQYAINSFTAEFFLKNVLLGNPTHSSDALLQHEEHVNLDHITNQKDQSTIGRTLCIQDPFNNGYNICGTVSAKLFHTFQRACTQTSTLLERLQAEREPSLMSVFTPLESEKKCKVYFDHLKHTNSRRQFGQFPNIRQNKISAKDSAIEMTRRVQTKLRTFNMDFVQVYNEHTRYAVFDISKGFRANFTSHMKNRHDTEVTEVRLNSQICKLWSTFALDFIRTMWEKCYKMDVSEKIIFEELLDDDDIEDDVDFPTGYEMYCSVIDCVGYLSPEAGFRWRMKKLPEHKKPSRLQRRVQRLKEKSVPLPSLASNTVTAAPEFYVNPFDEESIITEAMKKPNQRRKRGQATWKFQCTVIYENLRTNDVPNPKIVFILTGQKEQNKIIGYVVAALKNMFERYLVYLLKLWLDKKF